MSDHLEYIQGVGVPHFRVLDKCFFCSSRYPCILDWELKLNLLSRQFTQECWLGTKRERLDFPVIRELAVRPKRHHHKSKVKRKIQYFNRGRNGRSSKEFLVVPLVEGGGRGPLAVVCHHQPGKEHSIKPGNAAKTITLAFRKKSTLSNDMSAVAK